MTPPGDRTPGPPHPGGRLLQEPSEREDSVERALRPAAASPSSLSIVVVNWNGGVLVPELLAALNEQTLPHFQLVWVDNASTDDSWARLRAFSLRPGIALTEVALTSNRGVAGGRTAGIWAATGSVLGFLDVDAEPAPTWAAEAVRCMDARPEAGVLASWVVFPDGRLNGFGAHLDGWGHGRDDGFGAAPGALQPGASPTGYAMGCGMVLRARVARALELDPTPIKWHDDSEVALQARAVGAAVWREPSLVVVHKKGHSDAALAREARGRSGAPASADSFYLAERARARLLLKYAPWPVVAANGVRDAWTAVRSLRQPEVAWALARAHLWNAKHLGSALGYRRRWAAGVGWSLAGPPADRPEPPPASGQPPEDEA